MFSTASDLAYEYDLPKLLHSTHMSDKRKKDLDLLMEYHMNHHLIKEIGELLMDNIKFFRKAGYYYQCGICLTRFFKTETNAR